MSLAVHTLRQDDTCLVRVEGEVDVSNAAELRSALDAVLDDALRTVEVDLSAVPYIDSTGIGVLVGAQHRAAEAGSSFAVVHPQRNVARVLGLLGVDDQLGVRS